MGPFNKLFKDKPKQSNPDNTRLLELISIYWRKNGKGDTYKNVVLELMHGNSFLMFPTKNDFKTESIGWTVSQQNAIIKLSSVVNLDGLKVLGAFTDEQAMLNWTKKPTEYTSMHSQAVLQICQENNINRIVINTDQANMFVIEHSKENVKEYQIKQDTDVQLGTPNKPLSDSITKGYLTILRPTIQFWKCINTDKQRNMNLVLCLVLSFQFILTIQSKP